MTISSYPIVTPEELAEFHHAKGVTNFRCERCGREEWSIMSLPNAPMAALPTTATTESANAELFIPLLALACANCGNLWLMESGQLEAWRRDKKGGA